MVCGDKFGGTNMDRYFDTIYYALTALLLLSLGYAALAGYRLYNSSASSLKGRARGITLAALGTALALLGGLYADTFLKSSPWFQQVRFASFYAGFALVTFGLDATAVAALQSGALPLRRSRARLSRFILWALFLAPLALSVFYLLNPNTFVLNQAGVQVQLTVYWIPMLATTCAGAILLFFLAFGADARGRRDYLVWIGAFAALIFIGLLRESLIIPDLGNPLTNLLAAFVPFVLAGICLCLGGRNLLNKIEQ